MSWKRYAAERTGAAVGVLVLSCALIAALSPETVLDVWKRIGLVAAAATASLSLALCALVVAFAVGVPLSSLVTRGRRRSSHGWRLLIAVTILSPILTWPHANYWIGFRTEWTPITGYCDPFGVLDERYQGCREPSVSLWLSHLVLPVAVLALPLAALVAIWFIQLRRSLAMESESIEPANRGSWVRKRLRLAFVRRVGRDFGAAIGIGAFVEIVFQVPGFGRFVVIGFNNRDQLLIDAMLLGGITIAVGVQLALDLVAAREPLYRTR